MNAPAESVPVIQADRDARSEILCIMKDAIEAGGEKVMQAQDRIDEALARHRTNQVAELVEAVDQLERVVRLMVPEPMRPDTSNARALIASHKGEQP